MDYHIMAPDSLDLSAISHANYLPPTPKPIPALQAITEHYAELPLLHSNFPLASYFTCSSVYVGEGNGNPLQYSCLENPRYGGARWAAVYGVVSCLYVLKINPLSVVSFAIIFSHSEGWLFTLLIDRKSVV